MGSPSEVFVGLLDRSVEEIAALAADPREFDTTRIGRIADIWDNNTFPLVSAACAAPALRGDTARRGLLWMAEFGADRRALMVELDPTLDAALPPATSGPIACRDYLGRVRPGTYVLSADVITSLDRDYDLPGASVRRLIVRPAPTGLQVRLVVAAPRRFEPGTGRVSRDGSHRPWPPPELTMTFADATDLLFDADDRTGVGVTWGQRGVIVTLGRNGSFRAATGSVWPDDPRWFESSAGQAANTSTPHTSPAKGEPVDTSSLTTDQRAAARALTTLMQHIRLVSHYPDHAARSPIRELCQLADGAGRAILTAAQRGPAAFMELANRWGHLPREAPAQPIPTGPAILRYAGYDEPHDDYDTHRKGRVILVAAVADPDSAAGWRLASEQFVSTKRYHISSTAFGPAQHINRAMSQLTDGNGLLAQFE